MNPFLPKLLRRIPMMPKLLVMTLLLGGVVGVILDYAQTNRVEALFEARTVARLTQQDQENRMRFDNYVDTFPQIAKLIVSQRSFADEVRRIIARPPVADVPRVSAEELPPWLPDAAVMRKIARFHYAVLFDAEGRAREVYEGWPEPLPRTLLTPSTLLIGISRGQSFITSLEGGLFLITTAATASGAALMLAVRMNDDFIVASQGSALRGTVVALAERDSPRVIASTRPDLIPFGTPLEELKKEYLTTSKSFFDWGSADLTIQFVSLISRAELERLNKDIIAAERRQRAILSLSFILVFAGVIVWITRHIRELSESIASFSRDVLGTGRATTERGDELLQIKVQFRSMREEVMDARDALLAAQEELARKQKMEMLGRLAGGVGHELRNPLGVINNAIYYLKKMTPGADDAVKDNLNIIRNEVLNSLRIISDLLDVARARPPRAKPTAAGDLIHQGVKLSAIPPDIRLHIEIPEPLPAVNVDQCQMRQVLHYLITNAVQAMPEGGALRIAARRVHGSRFTVSGQKDSNAERGTFNAELDADRIEISVTDTGGGISPENRERLFEPLFTTKARGIGLGLTVARNLTEANGGYITVESVVGKGTTVTVILPAPKAEGGGAS